jgi:hypothetical protein
MRTAKARFWAKVGVSPLQDPELMPVAKLAQLCGRNAMRDWVAVDGFRDWFFNRESAKDLLAAASEEAVLRLWDIVAQESSKEMSAAAQVNAAKTLLEYGGFAPPKTKVVKYSDEAINQMSEAELAKYIATSMPTELKAVKDPK